MGRETTPSDLTITPRDRRFGRGSAQDALVDTAAIRSRPLSTTRFPPPSRKGEAFFVESVRNFREGAPPKLAAEIQAFVTQEVMHSREHVAFNHRAVEAGYDLGKLEERVEWRLDRSRARPPIVNLAATMALEHFTAILAHQLLSNPRHLEGAHAREPRPCGAGTRSRRSSIRASPTTPGSTPPATGRAASAGRSRPR